MIDSIIICVHTRICEEIRNNWMVWKDEYAS